MGWKVVANPPVHFRRAPGMLPLPIPERGGSIDELRSFLNVKTDGDFRLTVGFMVGLLSKGPYPLLVLQGVQGSAKSTFAELVRNMVDPNKVPSRSIPDNLRDLAIEADSAWLPVYDNLSGLNADLSDALCRIATGGGFGTRALYTDGEQKLFFATRPVILTGLDAIATRGDLADRAIVLSLQPISEEKRLLDSAIRQRFELARPRILGCLLDGVSCALRRRDTIRLAGLPRMADFALWVEAAAPAFGWADGGFLADYSTNRDSSSAATLDADDVAQAVLTFLSGGNAEWTGAPRQLLHLLSAAVDEGVRSGRNWPRTAHHLTNRLNRLLPALGKVGAEVTCSRTKAARTITLRRTGAFVGDAG